MPRLMLDTNICIHAIKRNEPEIVRRLERTRPRDVAISGVLAAELRTGVIKSRERQSNEQALNDFLAFVEVLDWPSEAAPFTVKFGPRWKAKGRPIGAMDLLIAAHTIHARAVLATRNRDEFARVEGLRIESWD